MIFRNGDDTEYLVQTSKVRTEFRGLRAGRWNKDNQWTTNGNSVSYGNSDKFKILAPYETIEWSD